MSNDPTLLDYLRDFQESGRPFGPPMSFDDWRIEKARGNGEVVTGINMMGHLSPGPRMNPPNRRQYQGNPGRDGAQPSQYLTQRLNQPPQWIDDVDMADSWYSPFEPIWPYGPPQQTRPVEWNYPVGYNMNYVQPRMDLIHQLRGMRQSWGVLAALTTTRQDQLLRLPWAIQVKGHPGKPNAGIKELQKFFKSPDGQTGYGPWARKLLFDLFDADCPYLYVDRAITGKVRHIEVLDGAMIFPLIDDAGRRPQSEYRQDADGVTYFHRQPAYQQIRYGLPALNLSEDEIIYALMRPQPFMPMFGYGCIEQMMVEATEAIRKTFYQLEFWRSGSMPELIVTVPDAWNPRQIATFQAHFDALLSGNLSLKSKVRFVPGGMKPFDIKNASGESLWSQRDETIIRLACFVFSVSPTWAVKQTNRGTATNQQTTAQDEGLYPLMAHWKENVKDRIIQDVFGYEDLEAVYLPKPESDQEKQSKIYIGYTEKGIYTANEVRAKLGEPLIPGGDVALVYFGSGAVPLKDLAEGTAQLPGAPNNNDASTGDSPGASPIKGPSAASNEASESGVKKLSWKDIKDASKDAGLPTHPQREAGNFPKGRIRVHGLPISIENAKGSIRKGKDWQAKMPTAYGYIRGYTGADGDQIDVFLGKTPDSEKVWVIDQNKYKSAEFDEHKIMLGYKKLAKALKDYHKAYAGRDGANRFRTVTECSVDELKTWLKTGNLTIPCSGQVGSLVKSDTISTSTNILSSGYTRRKKKKKSKSSFQGPRWLELSV